MAAETIARIALKQKRESLRSSNILATPMIRATGWALNLHFSPMPIKSPLTWCQSLCLMPQQNMALYEFIEGEKLVAGEITQKEVDKAIEFFCRLNAPGGVRKRLPLATLPKPAFPSRNIYASSKSDREISMHRSRYKGKSGCATSRRRTEAGLDGRCKKG